MEKDTTRKPQVGETISLLEFESNGDGDGKDYEVEAICDSEVYTRESECHLPGFYYLISWKGYPKEKNTWEPSLAIQHLRRLVSTFHKEHLEKPTATSTPVNSAPTMAKPAVKPGSANKKNKADQPRPLALTNALKRDELSIFILFSTLSLPKKKNFSLHVTIEGLHPVQFHSWIFLLKHLPGQDVFSINAFFYTQLTLLERISRG